MHPEKPEIFDRSYSDWLYSTNTEENQLKALSYAGRFAKKKKEAQEIIIRAVQGHGTVSETVVMEAKQQFYLFFHDYVFQQCQKSLVVELNRKSDSCERLDMIQDLMQSCFEAIFREIGKYNPAKASLTTFFTPIMKDARDIWRGEQKPISITKSRLQKDREVKRAMISLENENKENELLQIMEKTGLKPSQIILSKARIDMNNSILSLDADDLADIPSDYVEPEKQILNKEWSREIMDAVHLLSQKEKLALFYTNGIEEYEGELLPSKKTTISKAAEILGISERELHRYQASAIEKLKNRLSEKDRTTISTEDRILSKSRVTYSMQPEDREVEDMVDTIIEIIEIDAVEQEAM